MSSREASRSRGTSKCSSRRDRKSTTSCSTISKYFIKQPSTDDQQSDSSNSNQSPQDIETPYRNLINVKPIILNKSLGDDDFNPKPKFKAVKLFPPKTQKLRNKSPKKKKKPSSQTQNSVLKITKDNFGNLHSDVNSDQLQLAIALSKSTYESECSEKSEENSVDAHILPSTSKTVGTTLDRFGFKSDKLRLEPNLRKYAPTNNVPNKRKKSRYAYITPILFIRTDEDRESLVSAKTNLILTKTSLPPESSNVETCISSQKLRQYQCKERRIFNTDFIYENNEFYLKTLNLPRETAKCGHLLSKWENIAGRDKSPERIIIISEEDTPITITTSEEEPTSNDIVNEITSGNVAEKGYIRCISPDLFQSDSEHETSFKKDYHSRDGEVKNEICETPTNSDDEILSQSLLSPKKTPKKSPKKNSPFKLQIDVSSQISTCLDFDVPVIDLTSPCEDKNLESPPGFEENSIDNLSFDYNSTAALNVTDYITQMLSQNPEAEKKGSEGSRKENTGSISSEYMDELLLSDNVSKSSKTSSENSKMSNKNLGVIKDVKLEREFEESCEKKNSSSDDIGELRLSQESSKSYQESQESIVISDEELNYSSVIHNQTDVVKKTREYYELNEFEEADEEKPPILHSVVEMNSPIEMPHLSTTPILPHKRILEIKSQNTPNTAKRSLTQSFLNDSLDNVFVEAPIFEQLQSESNIVNVDAKKSSTQSDICSNSCDDITPRKMTRILAEKAPGDNLTIKTKNVTPMPNYDKMSSPTISKELEKFGLKPLKRQRAVKLLKYLYESTHPIIDDKAVSNEARIVVKKRKKEKNNVREITAIEISNEGNLCVGTTETFDVVQNESDLIFESRESVRIASCRIPLQIVWHNFLACNKEIAENILLYEPIQLEVIHSMIKELGFKFRIQDLQTFLDKKCITIRVNSGARR